MKRSISHRRLSNFFSCWQSPLVWRLPPLATPPVLFLLLSHNLLLLPLLSLPTAFKRVKSWGVFTVHKYHKNHQIQSDLSSSFSWQSEIVKAVHMTLGWKFKGRDRKLPSPRGILLQLHHWCSDCNIFQQDARCGLRDITEISLKYKMGTQSPIFSYYKNWPNFRTET